MRFFAATLGCKVNQYETQMIADTLVSRGHERSGKAEDCDVCIINTCAVTAESARKSRQAVRRLKKAAPGALTAVCGCLSQLEHSAPAALGADITGGSGGRYEFALEVEKCFYETSANKSMTAERQAKILVDDPAIRDVFEELPPFVLADISPDAPPDSPPPFVLADMPHNEPLPAEAQPRAVTAGRTRALLKIQDGCDNYCAYCVIPYARGRARSLPLARAADQARRLEGQGFREIVVTGIEISSYGGDLDDKPTLTSVLREISAAAPHARLRLGSLDPRIVTEEFCRELSGIGRICDHFHLSLQSGCDETLRRMGRSYDTGLVRDAVSALRNYYPDCGLTADLIVGFPGETEDEFDSTIRFIKSVAFSDMHIFPFSARPGTRAAALPHQLEKSIKSERARAAAAVAAGMAHEFISGLTGKTVEVLFERKRDGFWTGHSGNYVEVTAESGGARNALRKVLVTGADGGRVLGKIICEQDTLVI